jgi:hypothetical protein
MNQHELPLPHTAQRMAAERRHARLRAEAELGIDAPRRGPSGRTEGAVGGGAGRPDHATRSLRAARDRRGARGRKRRTEVSAAGAEPGRRGDGVRLLQVDLARVTGRGDDGSRA